MAIQTAEPYALEPLDKGHPEASRLAALHGQLDALMRRVPGWRRRFRYEESFGMPPEEQYGIRGPSPSNLRLISQLHYLVNLAAIEHALPLEALERALAAATEALDRDEALTEPSCRAIEAELVADSGLVAMAQRPELILVGHAHLDMNWMWPWDETCAAVVASMRTMLDLMEEDEGFTFAQSQGAVYRIIEDYAPELKPAIMARIAEGRWEVTATNWVETDRNMPSTASLLRHLEHTRHYMSEHWGVDPATLRVDFQPDTFGHSAQMPQLNRLGELPWLYHCRAIDGDMVLYRWRAPSGDELLVQREPYWYNSAITPHIGTGLPEIMRRSGGLAMGLSVYGVGNHGGGVTRRDLAMAHEMMGWPLWPRLRFGRLDTYFQAAEAVRERVPLVERELNFIFPGCYTSQSRIKAANKRAERAIYEAKLWDALAPQPADGPARAALADEAVEGLLLTHFHDILTGSNTRESREHALGILQMSLAHAGSRSTIALDELTRGIDSAGLVEAVVGASPAPQLDVLSQAPGAGPGFGMGNLNAVSLTERGRGLARVWQILNPLPDTRRGLAMLHLWDWPGDLRRIRIRDEAGEPVAHQLLDQQLVRYWDHMYVRLLVEVEVEGLGYRSLVLDEAPTTEIPTYYQRSQRSHHPYEPIVLENERIRAVFSHEDGALIELIDRASGASRIPEGARGGLRRVVTERRTSNGWLIGRHIRSAGPDATEDIDFSGLGGTLRQSFTMRQRFGASTIRTTVSLDRDAAGFDLELEVDWQERTEGEGPVPLLGWYLPVPAERWHYDIPGGNLSRGAMALDVPASSYGAAIAEGRAVSLISADCYGYRAQPEGLMLNLLHASTHPDRDPERGANQFRLRVAVSDAAPATLKRNALEATLPLRVHSTPITAGEAPARARLLALETGTASLTSLERCRDGALRLILSNEAAEATTVALARQREGQRLTRHATLYAEGEAIDAEGEGWQLALEPYETAILRLDG